MEYILVSACLLGVHCRYDGGSNAVPAIQALAKQPDVCLIPVCPDQLGGLPTPRPPAERQGACVINRQGVDVTLQFRSGAEEVLRLARLYGCTRAILKERSPSCGSSYVYDGKFEKRLLPGQGITSELLRENGVEVFSETSINK